MEPKHKKCYNCKHASEPFKIAGKTHHTCVHPKWTKEGFDSGGFHPFDTLMEFWQTCEDHELLTKAQP